MLLSVCFSEVVYVVVCLFSEAVLVVYAVVCLFQ